MTTTARRTAFSSSLMLVALMLASGLASAGTSNTTMNVGLTLVAPGSANAPPRVDGVINAAGAMGSNSVSQVSLRAALEAAPRNERLLPTGQLDGSRILAVQY